MDFDKLAREFGDDIDLAKWFLLRLGTEEGRRELAELKKHWERVDQLFDWFGTNIFTGITPRDYVSISTAKTITDIEEVLLNPTHFGLPEDSIFVGSYWPAKTSNSFHVGFYGVGQNIVLVSVFGYSAMDATKLSEAVSLLNAQNDVNFRTDGAPPIRTDRAFVHNELLNRGVVTREQAVSLALAMICWPVELAAKLIAKPYQYVETDQGMANMPTANFPGNAPLDIQSSCPRPMLGFVAQLPPTVPPTPVCVAAPCFNWNPTRAPSGSASIYFRPDLLVTKVY
ncbi:MAG: hypothetical protein AB7F50_03320 [Fimbriimonadaceae bacterium]